jgi:hypothetical protein
VSAIARGRRWLDEIIAGSIIDAAHDILPRCLISALFFQRG